MRVTAKCMHVKATATSLIIILTHLPNETVKIKISSRIQKIKAEK